MSFGQLPLTFGPRAIAPPAMSNLSNMGDGSGGFIGYSNMLMQGLPQINHAELNMQMAQQMGYGHLMAPKAEAVKPRPWEFTWLRQRVEGVLWKP